MLAYLILFYIFMADPNWGMLTKSAVDSEIIEQAIDRIVAVHEADPTAHLGAGESLAAHKADEILDHPAGSVVGDKFDSQGIFLTTAFESIDNYICSGSVSKEGWPGITIGQDNFVPTINYIGNMGSNQRDFFDFSKSFVFQFSFQLSFGGAGKFFVRFGDITHNPVPALIYGFAVELLPTGDLFRWKRVGHDVSIPIDIGVRDDSHTFKIAFDVDLDTLFLFVDGVEVASLPNTWPASNTTGNEFDLVLNNDVADGNGDWSVVWFQYLTINSR